MMDGYVDGGMDETGKTIRVLNVRKSIRLLATSSCYLYFIKLKALFI